MKPREGGGCGAAGHGANDPLIPLIAALVVSLDGEGCPCETDGTFSLQHPNGCNDPLIGQGAVWHPMHMRRVWIPLAVLALAAMLVIGLLQANEGGDDTPKSAVTSSSKVRAELAGAPAALAKLHAEDSRLL